MLVLTELKGELEMNQQKLGELIYDLRKEKNMTQKQVADLMNISDKTISKWERGLGYPDVSLLPELANLFGVSVDSLLSGEIKINQQLGGNMRKLKFYECPQCGNLMTATGQANLSCCGKTLQSLVPQKVQEDHELKIEEIDGELYVTTDHEMTKEHYITFVAFVTGDTVLISKQYPEWNMQFRFQKRKYGKLYYHCKKHGLFYQVM